MKSVTLALAAAAACVLAPLSSTAQDQSPDRELIEKLIKRIDRLVEQLEKTPKQAPRSQEEPQFSLVSKMDRWGVVDLLSGNPSALLEIAPDGSVVLTSTEYIRGWSSGGVIDEPIKKSYKAKSLEEFIEKYPKLAETYGIGRRTLKLRLEAQGVVLPAPSTPSSGVIKPSEDKLDKVLKRLESIEERLGKLESQK
jgi:hypothetical protein